MRIAISSMGESEDSQVSEMSGRAPYYLIFEDSRLVKAVKNPFRIGGGGAGFAVASMLADEKVNIVVSGKFGHNMTGALEEKGIKYKEMHGMTVKEALKKLE
jgi:predicted Fe-Mo cluster-binding NifX family protein